MNQLRLKALLASLIVSAPAYSNEIDILVNASQSIRDSFKYGIQAVGGMQSYASQGKIAPTGTVQGGKISYDQSDAYNQALAAVQNTVYTYNPGAQEYFDNQADQAMSEVNTAVDTFVEASQAVIEVVVVNQMAEDAQNAGDERGAMALQEYIEANDVVLADAEVDFYNESLENVESAAQVAAAYFAVANDEELIASADDMAYDIRVTYQEAASSFFDVATQAVWVSFDGGTTIQGLSLQGYFITVESVLIEGEQTDFFKSSPEGVCWFAIDYEACLNGPV
jgi:hypothetical protein